MAARAALAKVDRITRRIGRPWPPFQENFLTARVAPSKHRMKRLATCLALSLLATACTIHLDDDRDHIEDRPDARIVEPDGAAEPPWGYPDAREVPPDAGYEPPSDAGPGPCPFPDAGTEPPSDAGPRPDPVDAGPAPCPCLPDAGR
jgi:hypothetical protein